MLSSEHAVLIAVLICYTLILVAIVVRNARSLRSHHACSDVSTPLARMIASMLDRARDPKEVLASISEVNFASLRIVVFGANGDVIVDTAGRNGSPTHEQMRVRDAAGREGGSPSLAERGASMHLVHVASAKTKSGMTVATEAAAV